MTVHQGYALLSVYDKRGITEFAEQLTHCGITIVTTGGTAAVLKKAGISFVEVSQLTGFPEMLDGRVKTLHPVIHAGILARREDKNHMETLHRQKIHPIDYVVCNLYPFEQTIQKPQVSLFDVIENIDIGGPTLIRAAAKNYPDVVVLTNPSQYAEVVAALRDGKNISLEQRKRFAIEAYAHTAQYDTIIATYLRGLWSEEILPDTFSVTMRKVQELRYGENPHQKAAFYKAVPEVHEPCIVNAKQLHGKELSYNNILDADCALECVKEFTMPSCVIIKHATPCGIACASTLKQAWLDAFATDTYSPFGGIVAFNREVGKELAMELSKQFLEVIIAPNYSPDAVHILSQKKNVRLLKVENIDHFEQRKGLQLRSVVGGFLVQERDVWFSELKNWKTVTKLQPDEKTLETMMFAVKCVKHVKSNSVLFAKDTRTVAIGGGQTSRVDATWIATHKGKENIQGSVMASDAFFPFRDAVDVAAQAGVRAIVQPGGSIRDDEVIQAADEHNLIMVFTGQRYFRH
ncbi:MAG: bifunctional phosphoribosylaminoimidazolecarboxamide formyltransferase/IMP cyclohydrolase [Candidatus Thermoplasmatota archaeon]